tara:strand:- start:139 stop:816 length:678 start_codon:yes stop_codon:yes gene_type:complete
MALNINGTTGISGVDGSVSAPALAGSDSNTGITFPSADTIKLSTGGVERMEITNNGVVTSGHVIQVAQTTKTDTFSQSMSAGGVSGAVMSLNFTPLKSDSKLLISVVANCGGSNVSGLPRIGIQLFAGGSIISGARGDTGESNQTRVASAASTVADSTKHEFAMVNLSVMYLHTVSNTNQVTYDVRLVNLDGDSADVKLNRMHANNNAIWAPRAMSSITIQEVGA